MHPSDPAKPDDRLPFADRAAAGSVLADRVRASGDLDGAPPAVVLAIPRGGVPVAAVLADALDAPLDVLVAHKIGAPGEPELAVGAVASDGTAVMEPWAREVGLADDAAFGAAARVELARVQQREENLRAGQPRIPLAGRTAILVDDGMATGATMHVACLAARRLGAARVVVAVPIASSEAVGTIRTVADSVIAAATAGWFRAVGEWYRRFDQLDEDEVEEILASARRRQAGRRDADSEARRSTVE